MKFVSINRLEHGAACAEAEVEAEYELSPRGRRWRVRRPGSGTVVYFPDQLFHELFAPADDSARAVFVGGSAAASN
jgi:hypothetical protein